MPGLVGHFAEDFKKRCTLIAACDIQGFVIDAPEARDSGKRKGKRRQ
jgi:hypothetical protein